MFEYYYPLSISQKKGSLQLNANCLLNLESGAGGNRSCAKNSISFEKRIIALRFLEVVDYLFTIFS